MKAKYLYIYETVYERIMNGSYPMDAMIPDGETLAQEFNCSVLTVKKALDLLVMEGFIVRKQGLGTFVKRRYSEAQNDSYYASRRPLVRTGISTYVEKFEIEKANEDIAAKLNIAEGEFVYAIIRIRSQGGKAKIIEYTWMPIALIPGLQMEHLKTSLYRYIVEDVGLHIQSAHEQVRGTRPNDLDKQWFAMRDQDFVMELIQTVYLDTAEIFEYSIAHHTPEDFYYETDVIKQFY